MYVARKQSLEICVVFPRPAFRLQLLSLFVPLGALYSVIILKFLEENTEKPIFSE